MRWVAALALVLLVLVGVTVQVATRRPKRLAVGPAEPPEPPLATPSPRPAPLRSQASPSGRRDRTGVALIRGRARLPAGEDDSDALSELAIVADDGARTFNGRVTAGGRFAFHLPPGRYTLTAEAGDLVGSASDVVVRADSEREIEILLGQAASIRGAMRAPEGAEISVAAKPVGGSAAAGTGDTGDGTFVVVGLVPGRKYDLTFSGPKVRKATLREIAAPTEGMEIVIDPLAVVRGAVGFARGESCPIEEVGLKLAGAPPRRAGGDGDDDGGDDEAAQLGADCRFELTVPEDVPEATVVATGPGWLLEETVDIPARGDPEFVCLNPPCRENPTEGLARLRISFEGATAESMITAEATSSDESRTSYHSCSGQQGSCTLDELPVGETLKVEGYGDGCRAEPRELVVVSGDNFVRLPCHRQRRVEGVVRIPDGAPPEHFTVRCAGGGMRALRDTRLFELKCAEEDSDLEYRVGSGGPWRSVPLPAASNPAFVEISP